MQKIIFNYRLFVPVVLINEFDVPALCSVQVKAEVRLDSSVSNAI